MCRLPPLAPSCPLAHLPMLFGLTAAEETWWSIPRCICDDAAYLHNADIGDRGCLVSTTVSMLVAGKTTLAGIRPPATSTRFPNRTRSLLSRSFETPLVLSSSSPLRGLPLAIRVCVILGQLQPRLRAPWRLWGLNPTRLYVCLGNRTERNKTNRKNALLAIGTGSALLRC